MRREPWQLSETLPGGACMKISQSGNVIVSTANPTESITINYKVDNVWHSQTVVATGTTAGLPSIAINESGDTFVVSDPLAVVNNYTTGAGWVFRRTGNLWAQEAMLTADGSGEFWDVGFGALIDNTGDVVILGVPNYPFPNKTHTGAMVVFQCNAGVWSQVNVFSTNEDGSYPLISPTTISMDANATVMVIKGVNNESFISYVFNASDKTSWGQNSIIELDFEPTCYHMSQDGTKLILGSSNAGVANIVTYKFINDRFVKSAALYNITLPSITDVMFSSSDDSITSLGLNSDNNLLMFGFGCNNVEMITPVAGCIMDFDIDFIFNSITPKMTFEFPDGMRFASMDGTGQTVVKSTHENVEVYSTPIWIKKLYMRY